MALIVYLDTQDYINLFNESDEGPNHQVLAELLEHRDRGEVVIGFSFVTILEFITKPDAANRRERVRRGQLVKEICGPNAFPYPTAIPKGASFPNDGMWMFTAGEKVMSAQRFRKMMHAVYLEELGKIKGLRRSQRRRLGRKASMLEYFRKAGSTWGRNRADWGDFPVSDELLQSRIVERFMKGECSGREFEKRINAWLSDPTEYSRIVYDYADQPNLLEKYFGKPIGDIERLVMTLQDAASSIQQLNDRVLKIRTNLVEAGMQRSEARQRTKQFSIPELDPKTFGAKLEAVLGKGRWEHFGHYMARVTKPGYVFKRSDVMDLFQMCYTYDCDLFRCDKNMANTFRSFEPFRGRLVERFAYLPGRIRGLLGCKHRNKP